MTLFVLSSQNAFDYLILQGLCTQDEKSLSKIELIPAKNFNLLISLPDNRKFLIKQEPHKREGKTAGEFLKEWRVHKFLQTFPELSDIRSYFSEAVHFDPENSVFVFNYLTNYRDLMDFYVERNLNLFPVEIAMVVGTTLASIHRLSIGRQEYQDFFLNNNIFGQGTPNLNLGMDRVSPAVFGKLPTDGLKFLSLYQRYDSLGQAIAELSNAFTPCCLTHNDLKLNNILLSLNWEEAAFNESSSDESIIRLIDWERGAWGDPASDLGTLIASYLQLWLHSMITSKTMAIQESLRLATTPLHLLQPSIRELVIAYLSVFPEIIEHRPDFLPRVMQFCGFALIKSIQAKLQHEKTFGNKGICILQVAKSLLCRPEASIPTIFGVDASALSPINLSPASK
ncbi:phosphotransferase [Nostoc sp. UCD121]|uniref:phosphotransferase n=1 Tax=unclassified Nostoc TaxID=2593658 RepID=UPI0016239116|nr:MULTISPECIES: phosphotransferase [unclassified Nostoc]MBC1223467.1 phosphotransferase [Nostoc sp. UCD120]MBC1276493.1 phosphotransferase [Nostoc sp. UCD121]MBC1298034.1 phosphotransferase [Nostoc sp. UCD122]